MPPNIMNSSALMDDHPAEQAAPMTPAHATGAMGELDAASYLGQLGIVIGPGGRAVTA